MHTCGLVLLDVVLGARWEHVMQNERQMISHIMFVIRTK